jgi:hypothetical protein
MDIKKISRSFGLHPLVGFGMFAVDMMLFGAETLTFELTLPLSVGIGAALTIPSILIQRYSFKDEWGAAIGKGLLIGVLTAIPTSLPSVVPLLGGALGTVQLLKSGEEEEPKQLETTVKTAPPAKEEEIIEGKYEEEL